MSYVVNSIIAVFKRVLRARIMPAIGLCVLLQSAVVADDRLQWTLGADGGWVITDTPLKSWVEGGWGKLRYDENTDGLNLYHAFADAQFRISSTVNFKATLNLNTDLSNRLGYAALSVSNRASIDSR